VWTGFIWLATGISGGLTLLAKRLLASQKGLFSMELGDITAGPGIDRGSVSVSDTFGDTPPRLYP
jgi:hypothetical protein